MSGFVKTLSGKMGVLTIPQGTRLYPRRGNGKTFERAIKEFDVLAMPTSASREHEFAPAFSFKMRDQYWYVLRGDIGEGR